MLDDPTSKRNKEKTTHAISIIMHMTLTNLIHYADPHTYTHLLANNWSRKKDQDLSKNLFK